MNLPPALVQSLQAATGEAAAPGAVTPVAGGDIHRALVLRLGRRDWFVKLNRADRLPLFETELESLRALARSATLRGGDAEALGRGLAALHRVTGPAHGWPTDNFIGATPQPNGWLESWPEFWWKRRLAPQFERAVEAGGGTLRPAAEQLRRALPRLLEGHAPAPSLLHGDLWGGNHAYLPDGEPVIFDPASFFGDRETDLAMMELFGGFDPAVRRAYEHAFPLHGGYTKRRPLYQLYHVLNHFN
ncbi:MAG: fructosamine kinase family protein, partial [Gammaproteobacteria bacterium]